MTTIMPWAHAYISRIDPSFVQLDETSRPTENLFTSGRLDSMGLMNFLLDAEAEFGFTFTPEAFQDRRIQTISGLEEVIAELQATPE